MEDKGKRDALKAFAGMIGGAFLGATGHAAEKNFYPRRPEQNKSDLQTDIGRGGLVGFFAAMITETVHRQLSTIELDDID